MGLLEDQRRGLLQRQQGLLAEQGPELSRGEALGRLLAVGLPLAFTGGEGAGGAAQALQLGMQLDENEKTRFERNRDRELKSIGDLIAQNARDRRAVSKPRPLIEQLVKQQLATGEITEKQALEFLRRGTNVTVGGESKPVQLSPVAKEFAQKLLGPDVDLSGATPNDIEILKDLEGIRKTQRDQEAQEARAREEEKRKRSPEEIHAEIGAPPWAGIRPGSAPKTSDANLLKDNAELSKSIVNDTRRLREILGKVGTFEIGVPGQEFTPFTDVTFKESRAMKKEVEVLRDSLARKLRGLSGLTGRAEAERQSILETLPKIAGSSLDNVLTFASTMASPLERIEQMAADVVIETAENRGFFIRSEEQASEPQIGDVIERVRKSDGRRVRVKVLGDGKFEQLEVLD